LLLDGLDDRWRRHHEADATRARRGRVLIRSPSEKYHERADERTPGKKGQTKEKPAII